MSILIKGMRMPEKGFVDVRLFADGRATTQSGESPYYKQMDVIEIPEPHGDLIDRDALRYKVDDIGLGYYSVYGVTEDTIDDAPTVVEAEGGENE